MGRLIRTEPIDHEAIHRETGLLKGIICKSTIAGWCVQNRHGEPGPDIACITPPPLEPGETTLKINGTRWEFYGPDN